MTITTRFPPSPTGMMHIGNARTALFNYLYARHCGGKFVIRIEDTDRARHSEEAVQGILDSLSWLGLDYDNTPESQFANKQRHIDVALEMLAAGNAYKCYCTPEELQEMRDNMKEEGRIVAYNNKWRDKSESDAPADAPYVIRIKSPQKTAEHDIMVVLDKVKGIARTPLQGQNIVLDAVQGDVKVDDKQLDDFILLRSDGTPTYMLAVVVDDHDMGITHVLRGDDHLNNAFRQNVIYYAMGWKPPVYAHLPLIHGPNGGKLSKRHGSVSVEEFKNEGYLPETVCNYLLRLGWSHGDDEIISMEEAIKLFDFDGINKSAAKFDYAKIESLNAHYMGVANNARLVDLVAPVLKEHHDIELDEAKKNLLLAGMDGLKDRSKTLLQLAAESLFYVQDGLRYNEKAQKHLNQDSLSVLNGLKDSFKALDEFNHDRIEAACRDFANDNAEGKLGKVMMPLRSALTGTDKSPSLFEVAEVLGKEEVEKRLASAMEYIEKS